MTERCGQDWIETVLRSTGPRPSIPPETEERVKAAVQAHWRATVRRSRRRLVWGAAGAAMAAGLGVVAVGIALREPPSAPLPVAAGAGAVERVVATVWTKGSAREPGPGRLVRAGDSLTAGSEIATERRGRVAIQALSGHSLRLDTETRLRVLAPAAYALEAGAVYVDSAGASPGAPAIEIHTASGIVRDIGTQFEARVQAGGLRVRVREGEIRFAGTGPEVSVRAGEEMEVDHSGGAVMRALGDEPGGWDWIAEVTPMMRIEGRTLRAFLEWIVRERGLRLRIPDPGTASAAAEIRLQGTLDGLTLGEALESVLLTCGLRHHLDGRTLVISRRE